MNNKKIIFFNFVQWKICRSSPTIGLQSTIQHQQQQQTAACRKTPDEFFEKTRSYRSGSDFFEKNQPNDSTSQIGINGNNINGNAINCNIFSHFFYNSIRKTKQTLYI